LAAIRDGPPWQQFLELGRGTGSREGKRADHHLEVEGRQRDTAELPWKRSTRRLLQARGERAERVRQRRALRHGGHRDAEAERAADTRANEEPRTIHWYVKIWDEECADDGDKHAQGGQAIPALALLAN